MNKGNVRQDLVNLFLGIWAVITPWLIGNHPAAGVVADYGITGILIAFFACAGLIAFRPWRGGMNIVLGVWLLVSPWILGFTAEFLHKVERRADRSPGDHLLCIVSA